MIYHGYYFYRGKVGDFNKFSPGSYWTHNNPDYNDRVSSSSGQAAACKKACSLKYK